MIAGSAPAAGRSNMRLVCASALRIGRLAPRGKFGLSRTPRAVRSQLRGKIIVARLERRRNLIARSSEGDFVGANVIDRARMRECASRTRACTRYITDPRIFILRGDEHLSERGSRPARRVFRVFELEFSSGKEHEGGRAGPFRSGNVDFIANKLIWIDIEIRRILPTIEQIILNASGRDDLISNQF